MVAAALRVYFENSVGRILEHPDGYAWVQYHAGARELAYLQAFLRHVGQLLTLRGWHKVLGDHRQLTPYTEQESQWIVAYWLSEEHQGRAIYGAVILPPAEWVQLPDPYRLQAAQAGVMTFRVFADDSAALAWLGQQP
ncbi:hypothetical protein H8B13_19990 [Hymenobacter sp. BT188]|uniref:hypothetical protein n=1 Tax=Hymenobacter sp. BT188 TaxID=2763504 RepID=UPI001651222C|nr:hypothetical protein [Hymenobacter sp. BT188]MBC6609110.1 hypothetical protein [Hymenobacter sp. BT188]